MGTRYHAHRPIALPAFKVPSTTISTYPMQPLSSLLTSCAGGRHNMPRPCKLTLKVVSESCGYLCANFSLPRPPCSRLRSDVRDRQTSDTHHRLIPPLWRRGHNEVQKLSHCRPKLILTLNDVTWQCNYQFQVREWMIEDVLWEKNREVFVSILTSSDSRTRLFILWRRKSAQTGLSSDYPVLRSLGHWLTDSRFISPLRCAVAQSYKFSPPTSSGLSEVFGRINFGPPSSRSRAKRRSIPRFCRLTRYLSRQHVILK